MGIPLTCALMIQNNEVMVDTYTNKEKTGYGFMIYLMRGGEIHTPIISTIPNFPYSRRRKASKAGKNLVEAVREMDLYPEKRELQEILGPETSEMVSDIVRASREQP